MSLQLKNLVSWFSPTKVDAVADRNDVDKDDEPMGLFVLVEGSDPSVDIVAIHGLNGHKEETWTASNRILWLRDLLPKSIPAARVITYGYDSRTHSLEADLSTQKIEGHAREFLRRLTEFREDTGTTRRPIIFIAHSLGGIVLKSALILSELSNPRHLGDRKAIKLSTAGILFFGTPHQGSPDVSLVQSIGRIASIWYYTSDNVLTHLEEHSSWLMEQTERFKSISTDFEMRFFFESRQTHIQAGITRMIVPEWSAALPGTLNNEPIEIRKDHIRMVKFHSAQDNDYNSTIRSIERIKRTSEERVKQNWSNWDTGQRAFSIEDLRRIFQKADFRVPTNLPLKNESFIGRKNLLTWVRDELSKSEATRTLILFGAGGIGKTQLALNYAWAHKHDYTTVLLFNANDVSAIRASFLKIANELIKFHASLLPHDSTPYGLISEYLGLKDLVDHEGKIVIKEERLNCVVEAVKLWLNADGNNRWLAIYDNYNDVDSFTLQEYLPKTRSGTILITTRRRDLFWIGGTPKEIPYFSEDESLELLFQRSQKPLESSELNEARMIVNRLGNLPLAIDHTGAYIFLEDVSLSYYLQSLSTRLAYLLKQRPPNFATQYNESVYATGETSFAALDSKHPASANMLVVSACFFNIDIPTTLFQRGMNIPEEQVESMVSKLLAYSLIRRERDDSFSFHPLIHFWARDRFKIEQRKENACQALKTMAHAIRQEGEHTRSDMDFAFETRIEAHIEAIRTLVLELWGLGASSNIDPTYWGDLAGFYQAHGYYSKAEILYSEALKDLEHLRYPDNKETLRLVLNLAKLYWQQSHLNRAEALYRRYLDDIESNSGLESIESARLQVGLGVVCHKKNQFEEAEKLYDQGLPILKLQLGEDQLETRMAMDNLAITYLRQKKYGEAEKLFARATQNKISPDDQFTSRSMQNLALCYREQGKYVEAQRLFTKCLEFRQRVLGPYHPSTLRTLHNLASVHCLQQQYEPAENLYALVIAGREMTLGKNHLDTLRATRDLARLCQNSNQTLRARELLESTLSRLEAETDASREPTIQNVKGLLSKIRDQIRMEESTARDHPAGQFTPTPIWEHFS